MPSGNSSWPKNVKSQSEPAEADSQLQAKVAEMEQDRVALEEELENVRSRAVSMSQTITEQKRQMADEHAQWTAELRQLRRILDKQATWIAQQTEGGLATWSPGGYGPAGVPIPGGFPPNVNQYPQNPAAVRPAEPEHWRRAANGAFRYGAAGARRSGVGLGVIAVRAAAKRCCASPKSKCPGAHETSRR